jgi:hypothetical protein
VKSAIGTSPWFIQQLANHESPGYKQFDGGGNPVWGSPNGYGIMMVEDPSASQDLWS